MRVTLWPVEFGASLINMLVNFSSSSCLQLHIFLIPFDKPDTPHAVAVIAGFPDAKASHRLVIGHKVAHRVADLPNIFRAAFDAVARL
jgi:hypothetical protein